MKTPQPEISQMFFEFNQYNEAFSAWHENLPIYEDKMQMVISTHEYTSGYWIEHAGKEYNPVTDYCYTGDEVIALEKRVRKEIENRKITGKRGIIL